MANIARALHAFHQWGVPQDLVLRLVERRSNLRWQADVAEVPTLSQLIGDPTADKIPGTSAKARASQTMASKFKGKLKRINTDPEAKAIMWPSPDAPDAPRSYFDLMFDALICVMNVMKARREQATGNAPDAPPTDAAAAPTDAAAAPTDAAGAAAVLGALWGPARPGSLPLGLLPLWPLPLLK